jgi:hypothetical protein
VYLKGFPGSGILENAIGASFVYLLMAVFCSTVNEWISALLKARAGTLEATIRELLNHQSDAEGKDFLTAFYAHPIVTAMMDHRQHPSYLPSGAFVTAVIDLVTPATHGPITFEALQKSLAALPPGDVRTSLLALIQNAAGDLARAEGNVESWFNDAMTRASRSYKQRTAVWTVTIATVLTIASNADSIGMLRGLDARLPGWEGVAFSISPWAWISRITGWCLTIAAVSLGAPFWFDVLNRFVKPHHLAVTVPRRFVR